MNNHIIEGLNGKRIIDFNSVANNVPKDDQLKSITRRILQYQLNITQHI